VAVTYFTAQSRQHIVIKTNQNMLYLSPYHQPVSNSPKFQENIRYSTEAGILFSSAQNSVLHRKLWSLLPSSHK